MVFGALRNALDFWYALSLITVIYTWFVLVYDLRIVSLKSAVLLVTVLFSTALIVADWLIVTPHKSAFFLARNFHL